MLWGKRTDVTESASIAAWTVKMVVSSESSDRRSTVNIFWRFLIRLLLLLYDQVPVKAIKPYTTIPTTTTPPATPPAMMTILLLLPLCDDAPFCCSEDDPLLLLPLMLVQVAAPLIELVVPMGQRMQFPTPTFALNWPMAHGTHELDEVS